MKPLTTPLTVLALLLLASSAPAGSVNEMKLPATPEGYGRERFTEVQCAFLYPKEWHRFHKAGASSHTYTLSQESVAVIQGLSDGIRPVSKRQKEDL
jgi:hypothetical protein